MSVARKLNKKIDKNNIECGLKKIAEVVTEAGQQSVNFNNLNLNEAMIFVQVEKNDSARPRRIIILL